MDNKDIIISDFFESIVDGMRDTDIVSTIVDNSNDTYTITTTDIQSIAVNDYIKITGSGDINNNNLLITAIDAGANTFTVQLDSGLSITILGNWKANAPYSFYGYDKEVNIQDIVKQQSQLYRTQRFPLIWCPVITTEDYSKDYPIFLSAEFQIAFIMPRDKNWSSLQSIDDNFRNTLRPKYYKFMAELKKQSSLFVIVTTDRKPMFPHQLDTYMPLNYEDNNKDSLSDFSDALIIKNLILAFRSQPNCK